MEPIVISYWIKMAFTMAVVMFIFLFSNAAVMHKNRLLEILFGALSVTFGLACVFCLVVWVWTSM